MVKERLRRKIAIQDIAPMETVNDAIKELHNAYQHNQIHIVYAQSAWVIQKLLDELKQVSRQNAAAKGWDTLVQSQFPGAVFKKLNAQQITASHPAGTQHYYITYKCNCTACAGVRRICESAEA